MIEKNKIEKIKEFGIDMDWNSSFNGKSKGNRHLFRVVEHAKNITKDLDADLSIVEAAAWLHDTNLEKTITGDTLANKQKIVQLFKELEIEEKDLNKVLHCIEAHDGRVYAETIEAQIVHDADTLEKSGPLGILRETWKRAQLGWPTEKIAEHLRNHLPKRAGRIYTEKAKQEAMKMNKELEQFFRILEKQLDY